MFTVDSLAFTGGLHRSIDRSIYLSTYLSSALEIPETVLSAMASDIQSMLENS